MQGEKATVLFTQIGEELKKSYDSGIGTSIAMRRNLLSLLKTLMKVDMLNKWQLLFVTLHVFQTSLPLNKMEITITPLLVFSWLEQAFQIYRHLLSSILIHLSGKKEQRVK